MENRLKRNKRINKLKRLKQKKKSFLLLGMSILFLFGNTVISKSNTVVENNKMPTTDTFTSIGGSYSIQYILKNYGVFSFSDITSSHVVGPVIAKESVYKTGKENVLSVADLTRGYPSYMGNLEGTLKADEVKLTSKLDYFHDFNKGGGFTPPKFYTRLTGIDITTNNNPNDLVHSVLKGGKTYLSPNNSGRGLVLQNDNFVDFNIAKEMLVDDSKRLSNIPGKVVSPDNAGYLKLNVGQSYIIKDASKLRIVDLDFPQGYNYLNSYPYPTIINIVDDSLSASGTSFDAKTIYKDKDSSVGYEANKSTLPIIQGENHQFFPKILADGEEVIGNATTSGGHVDYGQNQNIIWNLPNITSVNGGKKVAVIGGDLVGHIVAPRADFYNYKADDNGAFSWQGGNINGAAIVGAWYSGNMEAHLWHFANGMLRIEGKKNYSGKALAENEFSFKLDMFDGGATPAGIVKNTMPENNIPETVGNKANGAIAFSPILFDQAGTYEFRIKEVTNAPIEKVTYDKTEYKLVATVKKDPVLIGFNVSYEIFKVKDTNGLDLGTHEKVNGIEFNNQYDYRLPSTGGTGVSGLLILGMTMMISSLGALVWKKYKINI